MAEVIDDLVILGRAVPEKLKDGRVTVCLGGISPSRGFIRIYPTRVKMPIKQWDILRVEVERNKRDTRDESWKIVGSGNEWQELGKHIQVTGRLETPHEKRQLVLNHVSPCVENINDDKRSLRIIRPEKVLKTYFDENPQYGKPEQLLLELDMLKEDAETWVHIKSKFATEPRLKYICSGCHIAQGFHDQKVLEWGFFEYMRKNPDKLDGVWKAAKLVDTPNYEPHLFVGNQANHRTSFIIISVLQIQKNPEPPKPKQLSLI